MQDTNQCGWSTELDSCSIRPSLSYVQGINSRRFDLRGLACVVSLLAVAMFAREAGAVQPEDGDIAVVVPSFPFEIDGDQFELEGQPVFLHILCYQPLEPGQGIHDGIREQRVRDDLRRLAAYRSSSEPIILRVYAQPTDPQPIRMPQIFYDGVRELGFWLIRDIYFDEDYRADDANELGKLKVDAVISEVEDANALDRIFAWEIGNEFTPTDPNRLEKFVSTMCQYIKESMADANHPERLGASDWVTWARSTRCDPLYTHPSGSPIEVPCLDYYSINAYPYDPERIRDHQGGPVTGTPFAGYLAALKEHLPGKPLVISETGLPDGPSAVSGDQPMLHPWYPTYRYGGLGSEQVAEGLADRYWDARLLGIRPWRGPNEPNIHVAGLAFFEWNDEWHKDPNISEPNEQSDHPEEHFGLVRFDGPLNSPEARYKLQQETVRGVFTMRFPCEAVTVSLAADDTELPTNGSTTIRATTIGATPPVRFRWESSRGRIVGDSDTVRFHASGWALGCTTITAVAIDSLGQANAGSTCVNVWAPGDANEPTLELLTLGVGSFGSGARASGRIRNIDPNEHKVVVYLHTDRLYVQPRGDMTSTWGRPDGFWWTSIDNQYDGDLVAWVVPLGFDPLDYDPSDANYSYPGWNPPGAIASGSMTEINDGDNDLIPDANEFDPNQGRYDDPDQDVADNHEEFLAGTHPSSYGNDSDGDTLWDNWEYRYFGTLDYGPDDDPDNDGRVNSDEMDPNVGTHPGRTSVDVDQDGLPDRWERRMFGDLGQAPDDTWNHSHTVLDGYELGLTRVRWRIGTGPWHWYHCGPGTVGAAVMTAMFMLGAVVLRAASRSRPRQ